MKIFKWKSNGKLYYMTKQIRSMCMCDGSCGGLTAHPYNWGSDAGSVRLRRSGPDAEKNFELVGVR